MKSITIIGFLLTLLCHTEAQHLEGQAYVQQTVMGLQKGYAASAVTKKGLHLGAFFQSTDHLSFEGSLSNYPFVGATIGQRLADCGALTMTANVKAGLVNNRFFAIAPEIATTWRVTRFFQLGIGAGIRAREAAVSAKIIVLAR